MTGLRVGGGRPTLVGNGARGDLFDLPYGRAPARALAGVSLTPPGRLAKEEAEAR